MTDTSYKLLLSFIMYKILVQKCIMHIVSNLNSIFYTNHINNVLGGLKFQAMVIIQI